MNLDFAGLSARRIRHGLLMFTAFSALTAIVLIERPDRSDAAFPVGGNGKIAWQGDTATTSDDIFVANSDGSNPVNLTAELARAGDPNDPSQEEDPSFSPDGKLIVFNSDAQDGSSDDVWLMNADGTGKHNLTPFDEEQEDPVFTADGNRIVFECDSPSD